MGWGGSFRGLKIKSPGNVMNCPENPNKLKTRGGWGGVEVLGGQKISPGSVMNCPEKKMLNPGGGWGGVEVLGVKIL